MLIDNICYVIYLKNKVNTLQLKYKQNLKKKIQTNYFE